jgi:hypothetical protein
LFFNCRFFGRLSLDPHAHEADILEAIRKCSAALIGIEKSFFNDNLLSEMIDVPGEKIWIELKLILRGRYAGHIMKTILKQQFAPILGARRCFFLFYSSFSFVFLF